MLPFVHPGYGKGAANKAFVVGVGASNSGSVPVVLPADVLPGDTIAANCAYGNMGNLHVGGTLTGYLLWKRLLADDFAPGAFAASGVVCWVVYRGLYSIVLRSSAVGLGPTPLDGFNKAPNFAGLLIGCGTASSSGPPPGAAAPSNNRVGAGGSGLPGVSLSDRLDPDDYVDGSTIQCGGSTASSTTSMSYELLF